MPLRFQSLPMTCCRKPVDCPDRWYAVTTLLAMWAAKMVCSGVQCVCIELSRIPTSASKISERGPAPAVTGETHEGGVEESFLR